MSTSSLVDKIAVLAPGYSRLRLLAMIKEGQDLLFDTDVMAMQWMDPTNGGFPPYLQTVAGTYQYDISAANLSCGAVTVKVGGVAQTVLPNKVLAVFIDNSSGNADYRMKYIGDSYEFAAITPYTTNATRLIVTNVPVDSTPSLDDTPPTVIFKDDPGTYVSKYFVQFTYKPIPLTSENSSLSVSSIFELALRDYVLGIIQTYANGRQSDLLARFESYWIPKFRSDLSSELSAGSDNTPPRIC